MITRLFFLTCLFSLCVSAKAQIGVANIAVASLGQGIVIGEISAIGKTGLPVCKPKEISCAKIPYVFTGNGYWSDESNWLGNTIPPQELPTGEIIIVQPIPGGECLLNVSQTINAGATLQIIPEKRLKVFKPLVFLE